MNRTGQDRRMRMRFSREKRRKEEEGTMKMASMGTYPAGTDDRISQLPFEIQLLILQNLDYVQFSRFAAVCKVWRLMASAAATQGRLFRLQQVPWLIQRVSPLCGPNFSHHHNILYKLEVFGICESSSICGSSKRWLLLRRHKAALLLNPITGQRIPLPKNPKSILVVGVILPHDEITVVAYFNDDSFYQWRSQEKHWTEIEIVGLGKSRISTVSHMFYHKGNIYAVNEYRRRGVLIIDISSDRPYRWVRTLSPYTNDLLYQRFKQLVECDGDLLMVVGSCSPSNLEVIVDVSVFKYINPIDNDDGYCWEKVKSIGEKYALLVGIGNSIAIDVSTNTTGFTPNCIYFLEADLGQVIRCFNLENNTFRIFMPYNWSPRIRSDTIRIPTWFIPSLT